MKRKGLTVLLVALVFAAGMATAAWSVDTAFAADSDSVWTVTKGSVTQSSDSYGTVFETQDDFAIISQKKLWADKFGLAFRVNRTTVGNIGITLSPTVSACANDAGVHIGVVAKDSDLLDSEISISAQGTQIQKFDSNMFNWTDGYSYSTNYVYLSKSDSGWLFSCNDDVTKLDESASAALDKALASFDKRVGYLQLDGTGGIKLTYAGVQYGMPTSSIEDPKGFNKSFLNSPQWTEVYGDELCGFTAEISGASYVLTSSLALPLNGLTANIRMAHGDKDTHFTFAFTSLYDNGWYEGTASVCLKVDRNTGDSDEKTQLQLRILGPNEEKWATLEEVSSALKWFETNEFVIKKYKGAWQITLNGIPVFENAKGGGKTVNDYLNELAPYFTGGAAYMQFYAACTDKVHNDGFVVESLKVFEINQAPVLDRAALMNLRQKTYEVGDTVRIALGDLFSDPDEDELAFFATKGNIENGIWTYDPMVAEQLFVTFTATDGAETESVRVQLDIVEKGSASAATESGCGANTTAACLFAAMALLVSSVAIIVKKGRKNNEKIG